MRRIGSLLLIVLLVLAACWFFGPTTQKPNQRSSSAPDLPTTPDGNKPAGADKGPSVPSANETANATRVNPSAFFMVHLPNVRRRRESFHGALRRRDFK